jgi:hypothetical protein
MMPHEAVVGRARRCPDMPPSPPKRSLACKDGASPLWDLTWYWYCSPAPALRQRERRLSRSDRVASTLRWLSLSGLEHASEGVDVGRSGLNASFASLMHRCVARLPQGCIRHALTRVRGG